MVTPVELPNIPYLDGVMFEPELYQIADPAGGGAGQTFETFDPVWVSRYRVSGFPTREARDDVRGFLDGLEGMKTPVLTYDATRRVPRAYYDDAGQPLASGSPWGAPSISGYSRSLKTFDLVGWTANIQLYTGDYISFQDTNSRWHLHRLTADALVSGTGTVTVAVTPRPARGLTHGNAVLRIRDACCTSVLRWNPSDLTFSSSNGGALTIEGRQVPRAFI